MGSAGGSLKAGALEAMPNDGVNSSGISKADAGSSCTQKNTATGTWWSTTAQIRSDRFANFCQQGQVATRATFATNAQLSRVPVHVPELERHHFPGTQTQPCEQEHNSVVATPHRRAPVDVGQQLPNLARPNRARDGRHRPVGYDGYSSR